MSTLPANMLVSIIRQRVCVKISGRANFASSVDFKKLVTELRQRGYGHYVLDLSECLIMDSTFLGVLAGFGIALSKNNDPRDHEIELVNPNARIADLLENLGIGHLFSVHTGTEPTSCDYQPIPQSGQTPSKAELSRTSLEAHRTLMEVNPENVPKFKDVAQFLAEDLKKMEQQE